ncbi:MAG: macro domain-containing protein [Verrucomicrobiia bacterium]|jgi:O-acetyl-ADP-ribose deacetylase (regulator of RNase III)
MQNRVNLVMGDITTLDTDAIVNAANTSLLSGGGVDGAIHRAAGPELIWECRKLNGCPTGGAKITKGHGLPARHVIHAVGPIWQGGDRGEPELLQRAYRSCYDLVEQYELPSVAFPSISTGAYRYPPKAACKIAVTEAREFFQRDTPFCVITFVCYDQTAMNLYRPMLDEVIGSDVRKGEEKRVLTPVT